MGLIRYGTIVKLHGLSGEVKLLPLSHSLDNIARLERIFIESAPGEKAQEFRIVRARIQKDWAIVKLKGVESPNRAEKLKGAVAYVEASELTELENDEYYWFELIGLEVYTENGRYIGKVENLIERALQSLLIVKNEEQETLIPLTEPFIKTINLEESKIIISPIQGLLE